MSETFDRSMAHWSEQGREEMDAFYAVATKDYRLLAESFDWAGALRELPEGRRRVLDIACGSGKFPAALAQYALPSDAEPLALDLLDPSEFSIEETARSLRPPFRAGERLCTKLQDLEYEQVSLAWAVHGLYAVPQAELAPAMQRLRSVLEPGGWAFIAQARRRSHYVHFHDLYLREGGSAQPYTAAEDVITVLETLGARLEVRELSYDGVVEAGRDDVLEGYLQRCLFDDTHSLAELREHPSLGPYLADCRQPDGSHHFAQSVAMIFVR